MSHNSMMYLLIGLIIAAATTTVSSSNVSPSASGIQKSLTTSPCDSDECRLAELGLFFPQELVESPSPSQFNAYQERPSSYNKIKRNYEFVRYGRSAPIKKASYDYIRFGRK